mgnify:CR=1 FL=1
MSNEAQEAMQEVSKEAGEGTETPSETKTREENLVDSLREEEKLAKIEEEQKRMQDELRARREQKGGGHITEEDVLNAQKKLDFEAASRVEVTSETKHVAHAFRQLADKIENGELNNLDFAIVIPKLANGDMPMLFLGNPIPNVMLEGLLHRMLTKMAFQ